MAGCASEAKPAEPQVRITFDPSQSFFATSYISEQGYTQTAAQGKIFYGMYFIVENISYSPGFDFNGFGMKLLCQNVEYTRALYVGPNEIDNVNIFPGGKTEGILLFEVPDNVECTTWQYYSPVTIQMEVKK
ncbi:MAG TPA: hypothetical protein PLV67_02770 [Methanofastidiosum sp.]|nr:hypothetical protein [Methanofastidiosum sp.]